MKTLICYREKARSCYWMTVTNQLLHGPPLHLLLIWWHYVTLGPPWCVDMKVRWSCVSEQFCDIHIKFLIPNNCWVIFLYCNKSNYLSIWEYFRFGQICLSLSATTFHFPLWKDLVLTSFYPSFKTFLRLPSSI